jgi:hypothetical protein
MNPMVLFIDYETKIGSFEIVNPSDEVREFKFTLIFGYNRYDSLGNGYIEYNDSETEKRYSLIPYLKLFPKRLVIPPRESQTVRVIISNLPEDLNRTLWTRIIINSEPIVQQIDTSNILAEGQVKAQIKIVTEVNGIIAINCGKATSVLDFDLYSINKDTNFTKLIFDFQKSGTSPFFGSMILKITDENNQVLIDNDYNIVAYESTRFAIPIDSKALKPGKLNIEATVNNVRITTPPKLRIPFNPLTNKFNIEY